MSSPRRQQVALHTVLRPGMEAAYEVAHAHQPAAMTQALRDAGVTGWRIWRSGRDLFHLVEVADFTAMREHLSRDPANAAWDQHMAQFVERAYDYTQDGGPEDGLHLVWTLPADPAADPAGDPP